MSSTQFAVLKETGQSLTVSDGTSFEDYTAQTGGAVYIDLSEPIESFTAQFNTVIFTRCSSGTHGGAIYAALGEKDRLVIEETSEKKCAFTNCFCSTSGGASLCV